MTLPTRSITTTFARRAMALATLFAAIHVPAPFTLPASIRRWTSTRFHSTMIRRGIAANALRLGILPRRPRSKTAYLGLCVTSWISKIRLSSA